MCEFEYIKLNGYRNYIQLNMFKFISHLLLF